MVVNTQIDGEILDLNLKSSDLSEVFINNIKWFVINSCFHFHWLVCNSTRASIHVRKLLYLHMSVLLMLLRKMHICPNFGRIFKKICLKPFSKTKQKRTSHMYLIYLIQNSFIQKGIWQTKMKCKHHSGKSYNLN